MKSGRHWTHAQLGAPSGAPSCAGREISMRRDAALGPLMYIEFRHYNLIRPRGACAVPGPARASSGSRQVVLSGRARASPFGVCARTGSGSESIWQRLEASDGEDLRCRQVRSGLALDPRVGKVRERGLSKVRASERESERRSELTN